MSDPKVTMSAADVQVTCINAAEWAVQSFKSGVHKVYPDIEGDLPLPDDADGTDGSGVVCRIKRSGEAADASVGLQAWEEWCLDPDQNGTILGKLTTSHNKLMRIKAHLEAPSDPCYCDGPCTCAQSDMESSRKFIQGILDE